MYAVELFVLYKCLNHLISDSLPLDILSEKYHVLNSDWLWAGRSGDKIPVGGARFSAPVQIRPWDPPNLLYNGYREFSGSEERPGREADPSPPSSAVVMKE
jgi:hypothetical protein